MNDALPTGTDDRDERASTQPFAALVAVMAVCLAMSTYAVGLERAIPSPTGRERGIAKPTLERVTDVVREDGVVDPDAVSTAPAVGPDGYAVNVTLSADDRTWSAGPTPPERAETTPKQTETAARPVSVRVAADRVAAGRLEVAVWA